MAAQRLSSVLSHLTPGQKPLDTVYVSLPNFPAVCPSFHMAEGRETR